MSEHIIGNEAKEFVADLMEGGEIISDREVVLLRLVSGEEVLGFIDNHEEVIALHQPFTLIPVQTQNGFTLSLSPWLPYCDMEEGVRIPITNLLVLPLTPKPELLDKYKQFALMQRSQGKLIIPNTMTHH